MLHQSISPAKPHHFVGCGIWLHAFWKNEACNELSSLHHHKRHNPAKWMIQGSNSCWGLYKVLCFFIWIFQSVLKIWSLLRKIVIGFKRWFPPGGEEKIAKYEDVLSWLYADRFLPPPFFQISVKMVAHSVEATLLQEPYVPGENQHCTRLCFFYNGLLKCFFRFKSVWITRDVYLYSGTFW